MNTTWLLEVKIFAFESTTLHKDNAMCQYEHATRWLLNSIEIYELWILIIFCWVVTFRLKLQQQIVDIENAEKEKKKILTWNRYYFNQ